MKIGMKLGLVFCVVLVSVMVLSVSEAVSPIGAFDGVTPDGNVWGWAWDADAPQAALIIHFYADAPAGPGRYVVGWVVANAPRPDLNAVGIPGDHGFNFQIPVGLRDGASHTLYVYAIDPQGGVSPGLPGHGNAFSLAASSPSLAIVSPSEGAVVNGFVRIEVRSQNILRSELFVDDGLKGANMVPPYRFGLDTRHLENGVHVLKVVGYDVSENLVAGQAITIVVQNDAKAAIFARPVGSLEKVRDAAEKCELFDIPDSFTRAFRDAQGRVNLWSPSFENYRMIGETLDAVALDCSKIMSAAKNLDFDTLTYNEWLSAPYTFDGNTVFALTHNEWYAFLVQQNCSQSNLGWVNSITLSVSTDGGRSFFHPKDYVVVRPPVDWNPSFTCTLEHPTVYGAFTPSNIISHTDGYYYVLYQSERDPLGILDWGTCIMRTRDPEFSPATWEKLTAHGWDSSPTAACVPLERDKIEKMHGSATWSSYFGKYVLVDEKYFPEHGVFFSLSDDLIHWSDPVMIFSGDGFWYPTLLDPTDTSRNFENTGVDPYLYFVKPHHNADGTVDVLHRDLMRQQIRFLR